MHQKCFLAAWKLKALEVSNFTFLHLYHAEFLPNNQTIFPKKVQQICLIYLNIVFYLALNKWN